MGNERNPEPVTLSLSRCRVNNEGQDRTHPHAALLCRRRGTLVPRIAREQALGLMRGRWDGRGGCE